MTAFDDFWGEPISVVTREQLLDDGQIIEADAALAREAGYKHPVGFTPGVLAILTAPSRTESLTGRTWDVLAVGMLHLRGLLRRNPAPDLPLAIPYRLTFSGRNHDVVMRMDGESFLFTLPHED